MKKIYYSSQFSEQLMTAINHKVSIVIKNPIKTINVKLLSYHDKFQ